MADIVAKKDIEILTKQVLNRKCYIFKCMKCEHTKVDPSLLPEQFIPAFEQKLHKVKGSCMEYTDHTHTAVSLDDMENFVQMFDILDKNLQEPKSSAANSVGGRIKEIHGTKRFGSMTDINKTLLRSQSSQNLNLTKLFTEPQAPVLRLGVNCNTTLIPNITNNEKLPSIPRLSIKQLLEHNMLKYDIDIRLDSIQSDANKHQLILLMGIGQKYRTSFDRLNCFFREIQQIQSKSTELINDVELEYLEYLDESLVKSMSNLSEALSHVRFIADNNELYSSSGIKEINSLLSDDLTDILEHFYRTNKYSI